MALHPDFLTRPLAHRGLHDHAQAAPENSPTAFRAAIDKGYGIELDLQISLDGQPIVFHDYELDRLTDEVGLVSDRTAAELGQIRLKNSNDTIPTLAQILALTDGRAPLLIELKDQDGQLGPDIGALSAQTTHLLRSYPGPVAVMSYNPFAVAAVGKAAPDVSLGMVTSAFTDPSWQNLDPQQREKLIRMDDLNRVGACFISHNRTDLASSHVQRAKASGLHILCWTVGSAEQEAEAREIADNITFEGYFA